MHHTWMHRVTHVDETRHTYEFDILYIWISHITHMNGWHANASCHTYGRDLSHIWMSSFTHIDAPCHTFICNVSHTWIRRVTHTNESYHTYECITPHMCEYRVTHMNQTCYTYERVKSHIWMHHHTHATHGGDQIQNIWISRDLSVFLIHLLSDEDWVHTHENLHESLGTPVKSCFICTGTTVKTCWKVWLSLLF